MDVTWPLLSRREKYKPDTKGTNLVLEVLDCEEIRQWKMAEVARCCTAGAIPQSWTILCGQSTEITVFSRV